VGIGGDTPFGRPRCAAGAGGSRRSVVGAGQNGGVAGPGDEQQRRIGDRYLLSARLGSGAMGTVWSGYDEVLRRRVAVKELLVPPGLPEREALAMRERMLREARALGRLSHPNVVTVYDVVDVEGEPVVVLELVPSRTLAAMIAERGTLSTPQAAVVGCATAAALRAAHRTGITHRDVKPANVLVADDGRVKLTDFGIARNAADAPMTTTGLVLGSPAYMAPEVAAGRPVTPAADLWGLGATLFAAVEGRPPYDVTGDPVATITEVVQGEVPRPRAGGPVAEVVAALMVKEPGQRMPLDEVRRRLRPLIDDPDDPVYPGSPGAPTTVAPAPAPRRPPAAAWRPVSTTGARPLAVGSGPLPGAHPLAADPGPLPGRTLPPAPRVPEPGAPTQRTGSTWSGPARAVLRDDRRPAAATGWRAGALVVAGAAAVLAGATAGWTVTRALAGQAPLTTVTVTTDRAELREHVDPLGFTAAVPAGWAQFRHRAGDGVAP
jgi:serine/threonine protein kinase